ncbi:MAG: SAM-dependent methyltransferase [Thermoanaerobaculia bacterium]|nr:SAM-dependent methyltransferase [Thermoanaerobaculia bacterium]
MASPGELLRRRIRARGPIPFAEVMETALYGEGGYYARDELPIGPRGDFVTGSSLSPLFGAATARLTRALDEALGRPAAYLEAGYGGGAHLAAVAAELAGSGRRLLAWDRVPRPVPPGVELLPDLDALPRRGLEGIVFSYELFDALPVHRLVGAAEGPRELLVDLDGEGGFVFTEGPLSSPELAELPGAPLAAGQIADLAPGWRPLYRSLAERLGRGLLVTCDYGFTAERLLDPRVRRHGTLACYRRQRVHRDPLRDVGRQDLTAHVDFSALVQEGEAAGLTTSLWTRQAPWLAACGLLDGVGAAPPERRVAVQQLLQLDGMGEEIRVLVQSRGVEVGGLLELRRLI